MSHLFVLLLNLVCFGSIVAWHHALISSTSTYASRKLASLPAGVKMGQLDGKGKNGKWLA